MTQLRTQNYIYIRKHLRTQNYMYFTKQLDFGTQIYTQKYTKHYYLIKLKNTIRLWYTNTNF
jgi:hypothetical protein